MSKTYYINAANSNPATYPYDTPYNGFTTFSELFATLALGDNDVIKVYYPITSTSTSAEIASYIIDESTNIGPFPVNCSLTITIDCPSDPVSSNSMADAITAKVLVPNSYTFINFGKYSSGSKVERVQFYRTSEKAINPVITITSASDITLDSCSIEYGDLDLITYNSNLNPKQIYVTDSSNFILRKCFIRSTYNITKRLSFPVWIQDSYNIEIQKCKFNGHDNDSIPSIKNSNPINMFRCSDIKILGNIFYNLYSSYGYGITSSVLYFDDCDIIDVSNNVMRTNNATVLGISVQDSSTVTQKVIVRNNVITGQYTTLVLYRGNPNADLRIINNIFYYDLDVGTSGSLYAIDTISSSATTVVDYNNFYRLSNPLHNSSTIPAYQVQLGQYNLYLDPLINYFTNYDFPIDDVVGYYTLPNSPMLGSGIFGTDIGVDGTNYTTFGIDQNKVSYIDDLIYQKTGTQVTLNQASMMNTTINRSEAELTSDRSLFRNDLSLSFYKNQYDWNFTDGSIPFTYTSPFYLKDNKYVLGNRTLLKPFTGMSCPANPGHGYSYYTGYEKGLFNTTRNTYRNTCG